VYVFFCGGCSARLLVDESRARVNRNQSLWCETLKFKCFRLSRTKTEYISCDFDTTTDVSLEVSGA
jgi:hypothetical protein